MLKYRVLTEEVTVESRRLEGGGGWRLVDDLTKSKPKIHNRKY